MKMLSAISSKRKEEPLLPQTIETAEEEPAVATKEIPEKVKKSGSKVSKEKAKPKKFMDFFIDGLASLFYVLLFLVLWLAPGILLGFTGGSYYQYKRMAPYVNQDYKLLGENWKLSTELWKVESILAGMDNVLVYEKGDKVEKWVYNLREGSVECNYSPLQISSTATPEVSSTAAPEISSSAQPETSYAENESQTTPPEISSYTKPKTFYAEKEYQTYDYSSGNLIKEDIAIEEIFKDDGSIVEEEDIHIEEIKDDGSIVIEGDIIEEDDIKDGEEDIFIVGEVVKDDGTRVLIDEEYTYESTE